MEINSLNNKSQWGPKEHWIPLMKKQINMIFKVILLLFSIDGRSYLEQHESTWPKVKYFSFHFIQDQIIWCILHTQCLICFYYYFAWNITETSLSLLNVKKMQTLRNKIDVYLAVYLYIQLLRGYWQTDGRTERERETQTDRQTDR